MAEIQDNSKERIAFELAMHIEKKESVLNDKQVYREAILTLYGQCLRTVKRGALQK